jgi:hypothetical protein
MLEAGNYKGTILDYGVKRTKKGDAAPTIAFDINGNKVYWQGSWNGGGMDICMKALLTCGLQNPSKLLHLAEGKDSGVLDTATMLNLVVEIQVDENDPTKKWNRVQWINADGAGKFKDAITVQEFASDLQSKNLVAELMRVAEENGFKLSNSVARKIENELPF